MARCYSLEIYLICEKCHNAILRADAIAYDDYYYGEGICESISRLEEMQIYQRYREMAVERMPELDWEWVHDTFDRLYKEVEYDHSNDALPYI